MGVCFILHIVYLLFYFSQLTLSVCVWRWSCDSLHESRYWNRWSWGCPANGV